MKLVVSSVVLAVALLVAFLGGMSPGIANDRTEKYRNGGCEVERKAGSGKYESKVECKAGRGPLFSAGEGKQEFKSNGCEVKREWKRNGEYKEEIKCD